MKETNAWPNNLSYSKCSLNETQTSMEIRKNLDLMKFFKSVNHEAILLNKYCPTKTKSFGENEVMKNKKYKTFFYLGFFRVQFYYSKNHTVILSHLFIVPMQYP
jgi:hypothetical protein